MIPANTSIQFSVSGAGDGFDDDTVQTAIRSELSKYFGVQRVYIDASIFSGVYYGWPWTGEIAVTTREAHAEINDVSSIVAHAIYVATGYMPAVSAPAFGQPSNDDPGVLPSLPSASSVGEAIAAATKAFGEGLRNLLQPTADAAVSSVMPVVIVVAVIAIVLVVNVGGKTTRVGISS